ncbi:MAG: energy transducer TonB [Taibaiella sp.]|nr:energy transducer TonB [Taibaiella sp.]
MKAIIVALLLLPALNTHAQKADIASKTPALPEPKKQVYMYVEQMPQPPYNLNDYLSKSIKYPETSRNNGSEGKVVVHFIVNKDGSLSDPEVLRGVDAYIDKEALRIVNAMPKWKPGRQQGKAVSVYYSLPIIFRLEGAAPANK